MKFSTIFSTALCMCCVLIGKDFGSRGHTFPIQENPIDQVLDKSGSNKPIPVDDLVEDAKSPKPVTYLTECTQSRSYLYTPEYVSKEDVRDHKGNLVVSKGERFNPLTVIQPDGQLLFFDGSNSKHIDWARSQGPNAKWILVRGNPMNLEAAEQRSVYFDQMGAY